MSRTSYFGLMALPVYGLWEGEREKLIATIRARNAYSARALFWHYGLEGDWVGRV